MKKYIETKAKKVNERLKRMKEYFNKHGEGSKIFLADEFYSKGSEGCYVLSAYELDNEFYYVLGEKNGNIFIGQIICDDQVRVTKVTKKSRRYKDNKNIFDLWIKMVQDTRERRIRECYDELSQLNKGNIFQQRILVYDDKKGIHARLSLTKKHNDKYYCVVKLSNGNYIVTKLAWYNGCIRQMVINEEDVKTNSNVFDSWVLEAQNKDSSH